MSDIESQGHGCDMAQGKREQSSRLVQFQDTLRYQSIISIGQHKRMRFRSKNNLENGRFPCDPGCLNTGARNLEIA